MNLGFIITIAIIAFFGAVGLVMGQRKRSKLSVLEPESSVRNVGNCDVAATQKCLSEGQRRLEKQLQDIVGAEFSLTMNPAQHGDDAHLLTIQISHKLVPSFFTTGGSLQRGAFIWRLEAIHELVPGLSNELAFMRDIESACMQAGKILFDVRLQSQQELEGAVHFCGTSQAASRFSHIGIE